MDILERTRITPLKAGFGAENTRQMQGLLASECRVRGVAR